MSDFFCKLVAPRPTFALDMTDAEKQLMQEHAVYWRGGVQKGNVIVFGLVFDPTGPYGIGIVRFDTQAEARSFTDSDPTIKSNSGFRFEVYPMPMGAVTA